MNTVLNQLQFCPCKHDLKHANIQKDVKNTRLKTTIEKERIAAPFLSSPVQTELADPEEILPTLVNRYYFLELDVETMLGCTMLIRSEELPWRWGRIRQRTGILQPSMGSRRSKVSGSVESTHVGWEGPGLLLNTLTYCGIQVAPRR